MLPQKHRFSPRKEDLHFFSNAAVVANKVLVLYANKKSKAGQWKATVVVSKKVNNKATGRTAIKRMLREALYTTIESDSTTEKLLSSAKLVVVAKPAILSCNQAEISKQVSLVIQEYLRK